MVMSVVVQSVEAELWSLVFRLISSYMNSIFSHICGPVEDKAIVMGIWIM